MYTVIDDKLYQVEFDTDKNNEEIIIGKRVAIKKGVLKVDTKEEILDKVERLSTYEEIYAQYGSLFEKSLAMESDSTKNEEQPKKDEKQNNNGESPINGEPPKTE